MRVEILSDYVLVGLWLLDETFFTRRQSNVKYLMKKLTLHTIMFESSQYMFNHNK